MHCNLKVTAIPDQSQGKQDLNSHPYRDIPEWINPVKHPVMVAKVNPIMK
jgi:hypothetical protein